MKYICVCIIYSVYCEDVLWYNLSKIKKNVEILTLISPQCIHTAHTHTN